MILKKYKEKKVQRIAKAQVVKAILKKNKDGGLFLPDIKTYHKATATKIS